MNFARRYANFTAFAVITLAVTAGLSLILHPARALLAGFDSGVVVFLALLVGKFQRDRAAAMRAHAARNEPDHHILTMIALVIVAVVLTAVWVELSSYSGRHATGLALAAATLALCWLFANSLFALHYAHVYYLESGTHKTARDPATAADRDLGGLAFPGTDETPDYWDFAYFAFVLGMTFQVSDVEITSQRIRRIALLHGLLAFLFNIGVVALSVSLVASVLAPSSS